MATRLLLVEIQRSSGALGPYRFVSSRFILQEFHWWAWKQKTAGFARRF
jgi:hypothetical protein